MPILASVPTGVEYTSAAALGAAMKRGRGRPAGSVSKTPHYRLAMEPLGEMVVGSAGANFTPHVINVSSGCYHEDHIIFTTRTLSYLCFIC